MRYRAISDGFIGGHYIHAGEEFLAEECSNPAWAVPVDPVKTSETEETAETPPPPAPKKKSTKK